MQATSESKRFWILHPFFLYAYPSLFLYSQNSNFFELSVILRPLIVMLFFGGLIWGLLILFCKDRERSALIVSLVLIVLFSYSIFETGIELALISLVGWQTFDFWPESTTKLKLCLQAVTFLVLTYYLMRVLRSPRFLTQFLNIFSATVLIVPLISIVNSTMLTLNAKEEKNRIIVGLKETGPLLNAPNIFLLLLDGYARQDVLENYFDYDNRPFTEYLKKRGFYVAEQSRANYFATYSAITAMLNMDYLDELLSKKELQGNRFLFLKKYRDNSLVVNKLRQIGYDFYTYQAVPSQLTVRNSDFLTIPIHVLNLNIFETQIISTTSIYPILIKVLKILEVQNEFELHREWVKKILLSLPELADTEDQRFIFAHIPSPHPPFIFAKDGSPVQLSDHFVVGDGSHHFKTRELLIEYRDNYPQQLEFLNSLVKKSIDGIVARSTRPVIIIIMSDHGSRALVDWGDPEKTCFEEARASFFAVRLPANRDAEMVFYDTISPVNIFRVLFNQYLGDEYKQLPDRTWYAKWGSPFEMQDVTTTQSDVACARWPRKPSR